MGLGSNTSYLISDSPTPSSIENHNQLELLQKKYIQAYSDFRVLKDVLVKVYSLDESKHNKSIKTLYEFSEKNIFNKSDVLSIYRIDLERLITQGSFSKKIEFGMRSYFLACLDNYLDLREVVGIEFAAKVDSYFETQIDDLDLLLTKINGNIDTDKNQKVEESTNSIPETVIEEDTQESFMRKAMSRGNAQIASGIVSPPHLYTSDLYSVSSYVNAGMCYLAAATEEFDKDAVKETPCAWPFKTEYFNPCESDIDNLIEGVAFILHAVEKLSFLENEAKKSNSDSDEDIKEDKNDVPDGVILCENLKQGSKINEYFKSLGVNTFPYDVSKVNWYYGIVKGKFGVFSRDSVLHHGYPVIKLPSDEKSE